MICRSIAGKKEECTRKRLLDIYYNDKANDYLWAVIWTDKTKLGTTAR